jgi:hypothetical protein
MADGLSVGRDKAKNEIEQVMKKKTIEYGQRGSKREIKWQGQEGGPMEGRKFS